MSVPGASKDNRKGNEEVMKDGKNKDRENLGEKKRCGRGTSNKPTGG